MRKSPLLLSRNIIFWSCVYMRWNFCCHVISDDDDVLRHFSPTSPHTHTHTQHPLDMYSRWANTCAFIKNEENFFCISSSPMHWSIFTRFLNQFLFCHHKLRAMKSYLNNEQEIIHILQLNDSQQSAHIYSVLYCCASLFNLIKSHAIFVNLLKLSFLQEKKSHIDRQKTESRWKPSETANYKSLITLIASTHKKSRQSLHKLSKINRFSALQCSTIAQVMIATMIRVKN